MKADSAVARQLALDFVSRARTVLEPYLWFPSRFEAELGMQVGHHQEDNDAYRVDVVTQEILDGLVEERGIAGRVFSEETGWRRYGSGNAFTVVCDPFDNSFLSTRSFRDSSVVISIGDGEGRFYCSALGDLATSSVYFADQHGSRVLEQDGERWRERTMRTSRVTRLEEAFVVLPAILRTHRPQAMEVPDLVARSKHLITMDGAIFLGRLGAGYVDAYIDVEVGQPVYEVASLEVILRAGGTVTDREGLPLDFERVVHMVQQDPSGRTGVVAAATKELHADIMRTLQR